MKTTKTTIGEFKGSPTISISQDEAFCISINKTPSDRPIITFGLTKAKAILENIEDIKKFVEDHGKK